MKTIQVRWTRHAGHCRRSRGELISYVLLWTSTYGRAKPGRPARTYIQQLCEDTGCSPEDLPEAMNDREKWRERVRDIRASGTTWSWWWLLSLVIWPRLGDTLVCQNPREACAFYSPGLYIYHLFVWSNLNFFPTQLCLVLYTFCANLLHSLIIWLIISSLSSYNLHSLFCCVLSILT